MRASAEATALMCLFLSACGGDLATTPRFASPTRDIVAGADAGTSNLPIAGTCVSEDAQPPSVDPPFLNQVITGSCQFSHLGRTDMYLLQRVDLRTGSSTGQVTFTAADGSTLAVTQSASSTITGATTRTFAGEATIVGGAGRFAAASGVLTLAGTLALGQNGIGHAVSTYDGRQSISRSLGFSPRAARPLDLRESRAAPGYTLQGLRSRSE
jgi:hypothetical protein